MGAHNFEDSQYAVTPGEAFKDLQETARYDFGHDPYNGTISTVETFTVIPLEGGESLDEWRGRVIDDERVRKWECCACVADPDEPVVNGNSLWHFVGWAAC